MCVAFVKRNLKYEPPLPTNLYRKGMNKDTLGRKDCVRFDGDEYRSVWYCHHLNEPFVLEFRNHKDIEKAKKAGLDRLKHCENCGFTDEHKDAEFTDWHTYICTVAKPYNFD